VEQDKKAGARLTASKKESARLGSRWEAAVRVLSKVKEELDCSAVPRMPLSRVHRLDRWFTISFTAANTQSPVQPVCSPQRWSSNRIMIASWTICLETQLGEKKLNVTSWAHRGCAATGCRTAPLSSTATADTHFIHFPSDETCVSVWNS
jgi:hypothetical protein